MSSLIDRLARRLAEAETVSRRDLLMAKRGAVPATAAAGVLTAPTVESAYADAGLQTGDHAATTAAGSSLPKRADLREIVVALNDAGPHLFAAIRGLINALETPRSPSKVSSATTEATVHVQARFTALITQVSRVRPSPERTHVLLWLGDLRTVFADLELMVQSTNVSEIASLHRKIGIEVKRAASAYNTVSQALHLPRAKPIRT